ncbi:MAG TPA: flagellar basal body L-ring protein FlgH [Steroidobacteraceae bacterium]|jgi:flagellar L-ring protein precursor FlgH|nr:flagellar basal body L-ring protein FlgH [Steroidobacteraceae bacterium]
MRNIYTLLSSVALLGLGACQTPHPPKDDDGMSWAAEPAPKPTNGSIYQSGREVALFENPIAHHVGDIVTIVLNESTQAQKSSSTNTNKATSVALPGMTLLGKALTVHGVPITSNSIADTTKFAGEGDSAQSNSLQGYVTVTVQKVLPNGNLYVKGQKWIGINQGQEYVTMSGVIRPIDLASDNSIPSSQVANAKISYGGKGALADANAQGWLSRFFNSPWSPF